MPTIKVTICGSIDAVHALDKFKSQYERKFSTDQEQAIEQVRSVVLDLESRGKELASLGSQFRTVKVLQLSNCIVQISATYGVQRRSLVSWLRSLFP